MKAIFLDIDGVLNNSATLARIRRDHADFEQDLTPFNEAEYLEPELVRRAGTLAVRTGAAYVVIDDGPGPLPHEGRLVQPSGAVGLTEAECAQAERILLA